MMKVANRIRGDIKSNQHAWKIENELKMKQIQDERQDNQNKNEL